MTNDLINGMTNGSAGNLDQFIVASRGGDATTNLAAFEQALPEFPNATILSRGGRPEQPHLVVTLPENAFEQLKSRFGDSLIIERNARLKPL
jgi:hypothetical protein